MQPTRNAVPENSSFDLLIVGAGPNGLSCAIEAKKAGLRAVVIEKGCLCNSIFHFPSHMTFFTTSELLEIGGLPFSCPNPKPTRTEALEYYRLAAAHYRLDVRTYHRVENIDGADGDFHVHLRDRFNRTSTLKARKIALAPGYYDLPNPLGVPGEELSKVRHYYNDPHPYAGLDVMVVGGKNSAAIAALELWRHGARVTLVHRGAGLHEHVKYWIKPDLENRIKNGEITALFHSHLTEIAHDTVVVQTSEARLRLDNHFVLAMTGYHPDFTFLEKLGIRLEGPKRLPTHNPETFESNMAGIYLAGVLVGGMCTNEVFIENGRLHGKKIATALAASQ
jgi:thioredoxin reductase (NADPH)